MNSYVIEIATKLITEVFGVKLILRGGRVTYGYAFMPIIQHEKKGIRSCKTINAFKMIFMGGDNIGITI